MTRRRDTGPAPVPLFRKAASVVLAALSVISFCWDLYDRGRAVESNTERAGVGAALLIAIFAAMVHWVIWEAVQRLFGWRYGAGGRSAADNFRRSLDDPGSALPTGLAALLLSCSITIPLATLPVVYDWIFRTSIVPALHWRAVGVVLLSGAASHLIMYGTRRRRPNGLRFKLMPPGMAVGIDTALFVEAVYAALYFALIPLPYRILSQPSPISLYDAGVVRALFPALAFFVVMALFTIIKYPESLTDRSIVEVRGYISTIALMFAFALAMYS